VNAKYADLKLRFDRYYKYEFTFVGTADDGTVLVATLGGNHDDIYREKVSATEVRTFGSCDKWIYVQVADAAKETLFSWLAD
jgi:hypothetical protein